MAELARHVLTDDLGHDDLLELGDRFVLIRAA